MLKRVFGAVLIALFTFGASRCEMPPGAGIFLSNDFDSAGTAWSGAFGKGSAAGAEVAFDDLSDASKTIISAIDCDYVALSYRRDRDEILGRFNALAKQGKAEGFYPLIIVPSEMLAETLKYYMGRGGVDGAPESAAEFRWSIFEEAGDIDAEAFFASRLDYEMIYGDGAGNGYLGSFVFAAPTRSVNLYMLDYGECEEVLIAKIPADNPWELAAWVPMGGWNECPSPAEQVAVFKYWNGKYGAAPAVVKHDIWQMTVAKPPATKEGAEALALEQFAFCYDIVAQGAETVRGLASGLLNSTVWFFWWD